MMAVGMPITIMIGIAMILQAAPSAKPNSPASMDRNALPHLLRLARSVKVTKKTMQEQGTANKITKGAIRISNNSLPILLSKIENQCYLTPPFIYPVHPRGFKRL